MTLRLDQLRLVQPGFTLEIDAVLERAITGVFGPSGAGKTSLLEVIAGLRPAAGGAVHVDGETLLDCDASFRLPPRRRRVGYVPQDLGLFPHLSVEANLLYGWRRGTAADRAFTPEHVTGVLEIGQLLGRSVTTLSGGEQQRVAFARAVLSAPRLLLLDEPMSSLDRGLKQRLLPFLRRIHEEFRIPLIYVTHDADELRQLCDEVLVLDRGQLVARGRPAEVLPT